jgi:hypothetical protein
MRFPYRSATEVVKAIIVKKVRSLSKDVADVKDGNVTAYEKGTTTISGNSPARALQSD